MNEIAVLSRGRADMLMGRKLTLSWLQHSVVPVVLWVHQDEAELYSLVADQYKIQLRTHTADRVSRIRDVIIEDAHERGVDKLGIFDDDLGFRMRRDGKLSSMPEDRINDAIVPLFKNVSEKFPMVALRYHIYAHTQTGTWGINKRIMWTPVLHVPTLLKEGFKYEWEGDILEDFHMQLQLVQAGYTTAVLNLFTADDQIRSLTNTGCNLYRTNEMRTTAAKLLKAKFPAQVALREKFDKYTQETYTDVTVRFFKA